MPRPIYVTKASGEQVLFEPEKIRRTCLNAGAPAELADTITRQVEAKVYTGMPTKEILDMVLRLLEIEHPHVAARYDLKGSIMRMGPAGFAFEELIAEVLKEHGYAARVHSLIPGASGVTQEIDVIATKPFVSEPGLDPKLKYYMIECKFHHATGIYTGLKETMYTYARFLDIQDAWKKGLCQEFDQPWLATNTKFSTDAITYANFKNIKLLGWNYPSGNSLQFLLESKKLYPITSLRGMDAATLEKFSDAGFMLVKDLIIRSADEVAQKTGLPIRKIKELLIDAEKIIA